MLFFRDANTKKIQWAGNNLLFSFCLILTFIEMGPKWYILWWFDCFHSTSCSLDLSTWFHVAVIDAFLLLPRIPACGWSAVYLFVLFPISWYLNSAALNIPISVSRWLCACIYEWECWVQGRSIFIVTRWCHGFPTWFWRGIPYPQSGSVLSSKPGGTFQNRQVDVNSLFCKLRFNSHTIWYTTLKCTVQWFLAYSQGFVVITII